MSGLPLHFFFYGTLIAGFSNSAAQTVHDRLCLIGTARAPGTLWAIPDPAGWYPALVAGQGTVHGVLYAAASTFAADDLAQLDRWEDFQPDQPARSLYLRKVMPVSDADSVIHSAHVYCYNQPLPADARPISGGDFRAWLTANHFGAYAG